MTYFSKADISAIGSHQSRYWMDLDISAIFQKPIYQSISYGYIYQQSIDIKPVIMMPSNLS